MNSGCLNGFGTGASLFFSETPGGWLNVYADEYCMDEVAGTLISETRTSSCMDLTFSSFIFQ